MRVAEGVRRFVLLTTGMGLLPLFSAAGFAQAGANAAVGRDDLVSAVRRNVRTADFRATGKLVDVARDGARKNYGVSIKGHWFPDGLRVVYEVTSPVEARVRLLLHMSADGAETLESVRPGNSVPVRMAPEARHDSLLGTRFTFEDLVDSQLFWREQSLENQSKCGARECYVLKSTPAAGDRSQYGSAVSSIDTKILFPVEVIKTVRASGEQRDFSFGGFRQSGGVWAASQIQVRIVGTPGSSTLTLEHGTAKANLQAKDFDLSGPFAP